MKILTEALHSITRSSVAVKIKELANAFQRTVRKIVPKRNIPRQTDPNWIEMQVLKRPVEPIQISSIKTPQEIKKQGIKEINQLIHHRHSTSPEPAIHFLKNMNSLLLKTTWQAKNDQEKDLPASERSAPSADDFRIILTSWAKDWLQQEGANEEAAAEFISQLKNGGGIAKSLAAIGSTTYLNLAGKAPANHNQSAIDGYEDRTKEWILLHDTMVIGLIEAFLTSESEMTKAVDAYRNIPDPGQHAFSQIDASIKEIEKDKQP